MAHLPFVLVHTTVLAIVFYLIVSPLGTFTDCFVVFASLQYASSAFGYFVSGFGFSDPSLWAVFVCVAGPFPCTPFPFSLPSANKHDRVTCPKQPFFDASPVMQQ